MGLGYVARLEHGSYFMSLDGSGQYALAQDFVPPIANITPQFYTGTSANRYGGGGLAWERAENVSWSFGVSVAGASKAEVRHGIMELNRFLARAGDETDPLYFAWRNHDIYPFEPLWGQGGAFTRLEIVHGIAEYDPGYGGYPPEMHAQMLPNCTVTLTVKPFALGMRQKLATASGGIYDGNIGVGDGGPRGLIIPEATTNLYVDPIFESASWIWTTGAGLRAEKNSDPRYVLFGRYSVKLTAIDTTFRSFRQSVTAVSTNTHSLSWYVKKPDGSAVTSADVTAYYQGVSIPTVITPIGDGWYRVMSSFAGITSPTNAGINVLTDELYACGGQFEAKAYPTPFCHGDMLGCSWSGNPHDSTSVRAVGKVKIPCSDTLNTSRGTIRVVWLADVASTIQSEFINFFDNGSMRGWYTISEHIFRFTDGINTIASTAKNWVGGDVLVMHFVYGGGGMKLYLNGVEIASGSGYIPFDPTTATHLTIGARSGTYSNPANGTFLGFDTFAQPMNATQVAADYANIAPAVQGGRALSYIPWLWTKDGDDVVDNCDDSSRDNWCVCGGIMGDAPAKTRYELYSITSAANQKGIYLGGYGYPRFIHPSSWYKDAVDKIEAGCSGGGYVETTGWPLAEMGIIQSTQEQPTNIKLHYFTRFRRSGGSVTVTPYWSLILGGDTPGAAVTLNSDSTFRIFYVGSLYYRKNKVLKGSNFGLYYGLGFSATVDLDYHQVIPGDVIRLYSTSNISNNQYVYVEDGSAYNRTITALRPLFTAGTMPELKPGMINTIWLIIGDNGEDHRIASTATLVIYATPRWRLL
jgi:hypothetical protein